MKIQRKMLVQVPAGQSKIRIDKYLANHIENSSRTKIKNAMTDGCVEVNGKKIKANYVVQPNDSIEITLPYLPDKEDVKPENIPLDILFEDNYLMIVNKPAGMVTHPAYKNYSGTLVNALMYYMGEAAAKLPRLNGEDDDGGDERAGIVHRLDKHTSGIMVVAKDEDTQRKLSRLFSRHDIEREYHAIVWGHFKTKKGRIEKPLGRNPKDRKKFAVVDGGKNAITDYEVVKEYDFTSLVSLRLHTGRTHQIRVHLSSMGHPVFGDIDYGGTEPHGIQLSSNLKHRINNLLELMPRQALHAKVLGFTHPITGKPLRFESELPDDMKKLIKKL
ncbi:MAG TPA: RluA family pseudouridine synthase [Ignavibacteria bacterium]|nr:RluA family pseudouridine synthase [Ignavibacteria bacterium]HRF65848.1 RluA family pseudouridine synthase [Ignavibacteria bacterium]HRJ04530.1 RluA family pseudouridine synthase [Ignavibacteria bacterium]